MIYALDAAPVAGRNRVARHRQHVVHILHRKPQQQRLGCVHVAVAAGHMRQRLNAKLARQFAGQQAGIHPRSANRAIRNRDRVRARLFKLTRALHKAADIRAPRRIELNQRDAPPLLKPTQNPASTAFFRRLRRLFIAHPHARRHRHPQQAGNLPDMLGRCAAAAADNPRPRLHTFHDLLGVIRRRAVVIGASFLHMGIACVGHGAHQFIPDVQRRKKLPNVIRPADAVQADGIHRAAGGHLQRKCARLLARPRESIRIRRKGNHDPRIRTGCFDVRRSLRKPFAALHGFKQKARRANVQILFGHCDIACGGAVRVRRRRADIRKHSRVIRIARPTSQIVCRPNQRFLIVLIFTRQRNVRCKRIRLDRLASRCQIGAMQRQNALRLGQAQTFYGFALSALRTERRARRAVKKQNALRQQLAHTCRISVFHISSPSASAEN